MAAASLLGMLLPFGAFGAIPVLAAGWVLGLELPLVLPLFLSNAMFNLFIPINAPVFILNGNIVRIVTAFAAGMLGSLWMRDATEENALRGGTFQRLFQCQEIKSNYLRILKDYVEAAGLFIVAVAVLKAVFSFDLMYGLQNAFYSTDFGLSAIYAMARLNVMNPFFTASGQLVERLLDFSSLAAFLLLFRFRRALGLYGLYAAIALLLAVSIFIR
jgi:hypothetical protein